MKVVIAGSFGNLGRELLTVYVQAGHEVIAADKEVNRDLVKGTYSTTVIDVTKPETLRGLCDGADMVISTVGLTTASSLVTHYDIDYSGNTNLLAEAVRAKVKKFIYISVIKAETDSTIPMLDAKYRFEQELKGSGIPFIIFRPTGYFYDIAKVFKPMIEKGKISLLGKEDVYANVISTYDFAHAIFMQQESVNTVIEAGGKETYSYQQIAEMFFEAAGKKSKIQRLPVWVFDIIAWVAKKRNNGTYAIITFSKWTLTHNMVADQTFGEQSFKAYITQCYSASATV